MQPKPVHRKMLTLSMVPLEKSSFLLGFLKDHSSFHYTENVLFGRAGAVAAPALPAWLQAQREGSSGALPGHCWQQEIPSALELPPLSELHRLEEKPLCCKSGTVMILGYDFLLEALPAVQPQEHQIPACGKELELDYH